MDRETAEHFPQDILHKFSEHFTVVEGEDEEATHVQYFPYRELKVVDAEDFYRDYCEEMVDLQDGGGEDEQLPRLGVMYQGDVPISFPVELVFEGELEDIDAELFLVGIVREAQVCIERLFVTSPAQEGVVPETIACLLEGAHTFYHGRTTLRARVHFPNVKTELENVLERFYPMLQNRVRDNQIMDLLPKELKDRLQSGWNEIINIEDIHAPLPLYLGVKDDTQTPLELSRIFPRLPENLEEYNEDDDLGVGEIFDPKVHRYFHQREGEVLKEFNHYFPLMFDVHYLFDHKEATNIKTQLVPETELMPKTPMHAKIRPEMKNGKAGRGRQLDIAHQMLIILQQRPSVIEDYIDLIGKSIHGSDIDENKEATKEGLELFMSMRRIAEGDNFCKRRARIDYKEMRREEMIYTFKTICYITRLKMPEQYERWHRQWVGMAVHECLEKTNEPTKLAEAIYREFFMTFLVSSYGKDNWYMFDGDVWEESDKTVDIRDAIMSRILPMFEKMSVDLAKKRDEENHQQRKKQYTLEIESVETIIKKLSTNKGINEVIGHLRLFFFVKHFNKKQNANIYATGVRNGVIEARKDKIVFRPGFPEDYITKKASAFYEKHSWNHPNVKFLMNWFHQMWPKDTVRFFLKYAASMFIGKNLDKIFVLFTGKGNNGKSKINNLFQYTFGEDYFADIAAEAFTRKKNSASGPTQEWEDARDTRGLGVNEPTEDFFSDMIKKITGADKFRSRGLNEKGGMMNPTFKVMIFANQPPGFDGEYAMQQRARIIECWAQYLPEDQVPKTPEEQKKKRKFPMDNDIDEKLAKCNDAFLWILGEFYAIYKKEGIQASKEMQASANKYWKNHDVVKQFLDEYVSKTDVTGEALTNETKISVNELFKVFQTWYIEIHPNKNVPGINKFRFELDQKGIELDADEKNCLGVRNKKMIGGGGIGGFMEGLIPT